MKKHNFILAILFILTISAVFFCTKSVVLAQSNEYDIGKTHFDQKRYHQAISQWEKLLQTYPNFNEKSKVWNYLGLSYVELAKEYRTTNPNEVRKNGLKAMEYFKQILDQKDANGNPKVDDPFFPETLFNMGQIFYYEGERLRQTGNREASIKSFDESKQFFLQLRAQYPDHSRVAEALSRLGYIAISENNPTEARQYFTEAIAKTNDPELKKFCTFFNAWALAQLGNADQAISIFNQYVLSKDEKYGLQSLYEIAMINFKREEYQMVITRVNTMPQTFPAVKTTTESTLLDVWHDAQVLQADAYEKLGQYAAAIHVMENVVIDLSKTGHPIARKLLADQIRLFNLFLAQKEFSKASNLYNTIEQTAGINTDELKLLGAKLDEAQGRYTQAQNILADLLGASPTYTGEFQITKAPGMTASTSLSEKSFYEAGKLLAICYAKTGQTTYAEKVLTYMYGLQMTGQSDYFSIVDEAYLEVQSIVSNQSGYPGTSNGTASTPFPGTPGLPGQLRPPGTTETGHISPLPVETKPIDSMPSLSTKLTPREQQKALAKYNQMRKAGKDKEAEPLLEEFFSNEENSKANRAVAGLMYGEILMGQGYQEQANDVFELVASECSGTSEALEAAYYLGVGAENEGDMKTARNYYLSAIHRQNKQYDSAQYRLATLEFADNDWASGMKRLNDIFKNHLDGKYWSHAAWLLVTDAYYRPSESGSSRISEPDIKRTEEILDEMLSNTNLDVALLDRVLFLKGKIAQQQGHWETAVIAYQTLIKLDDTSPFHSEAKRALNECRDKISAK